MQEGWTTARPRAAADPDEITGDAPTSAHWPAPDATARWALDAIGMPVVVLRLDCAIRHLNAAARVLIEIGDPLAVRGDRLIAIDDGVGIGRVVKAAATGAGDQTMAMRNAAGERFMACARRLTRAGDRGEAMILMQVTRLDVPPPSPAILAEAFGLTAAESRLAIALLEGNTIRGAAARFGTSVLTVRTQLSMLFAKTGATRQSELVRMLLPLGGLAG